jgi:hypothetical protein
MFEINFTITIICQNLELWSFSWKQVNFQLFKILEIIIPVENDNQSDTVYELL